MCSGICFKRTAIGDGALRPRLRYCRADGGRKGVMHYEEETRRIS